MRTNLFRHRRILFKLCSFLAIQTFLLSVMLFSTQWAMAKRHIAPNNTAVTTFHNDNLRTGQNLNETILTTSNVNSNQFGKRVSYPVDGQVYAQPLFMPNVPISGVLTNVVYVATENDSVYAFDADQTSAVAPLWHTSFINPPAVTPAPATELYTKYPNTDIYPQVGITGTPVIDPHSGTLFLVAMTKENGTFVQRLHALDITTGKDKFGSPLLIRAALLGHGYDNVNGIVSFHARTQNQRAALLLLHGVIYVTWGAFGDTDPYHGWVIGYAYNAMGFHQLIASVYNDTLNGSEGGIWMGGSGPAADDSNNLYLSTGNGDANIGNGGTEASDSFIKLNTTIGLRVSDYFSPYNHVCLDGRDADLGSGGVIALPDQAGTAHPHLLVSSGKEGRVYVIDRDHMGKYTNDPNLQCDGTDAMRTDIDKVVQELAPSVGGSVFGVGGYWSGSVSSGQMIYIGGYNDHLKAFQLNNDLLSPAAVSQSSEIFAFSGATPSISSNGSQPGTGIVWISSPSSCSDPGCQPAGPGALRAYDATNLNVELYNSEQNPTRDELDSYMKFGVPTIANGRVFVGTQTSLTIYGLLNQ